MPDLSCPTCNPSHLYLGSPTCLRHRPVPSTLETAKQLLCSDYSQLRNRCSSLSLPGSAPTSPPAPLHPRPCTAPCSPLLSPLTPTSPDYATFSLLSTTMGEGPVCHKCHREKDGGAHALCRTGYELCTYPDHRPEHTQLVHG